MRSMRSIDASKKHPVTLTFLLDEEVTPAAFAQKIAVRCGGAVLMPGEVILVPRAKIACVITDETLSLPSFGYQWCKSPKKSTVMGNDRNKRGGNVALTPQKGRRAKRDAAASAK